MRLFRAYVTIFSIMIALIPFSLYAAKQSCSSQTDNFFDSLMNEKTKSNIACSSLAETLKLIIKSDGGVVSARDERILESLVALGTIEIPKGNARDFKNQITAVPYHSSKYSDTVRIVWSDISELFPLSSYNPHNDSGIRAPDTSLNNYKNNLRNHLQNQFGKEPPEDVMVVLKWICEFMITLNTCLDQTVVRYKLTGKTGSAASREDLNELSGTASGPDYVDGLRSPRRSIVRLIEVSMRDYFKNDKTYQNKESTNEGWRSGVFSFVEDSDVEFSLANGTTPNEQYLSCIEAIASAKPDPSPRPVVLPSTPNSRPAFVDGQYRCCVSTGVGSIGKNTWLTYPLSIDGTCRGTENASKAIKYSHECDDLRRTSKRWLQQFKLLLNSK